MNARLTKIVRVGFDNPPRVRLHSLLVAGNLLLFETPFWQLDLVTEQITTCHRMAQPEPRPQSLQPLPTLGVMLIALINLDEPIVVGVTGETRETISRDFLLEIDVCDWGSHIV